MVPLTVSRLREWPRIVAGGVVLAVVLLACGLLIGATAGSSTTRVVHTVTATVTRESPAQAAQIQADTTTIALLHKRLVATRQRLAKANRALRAERRKTRKGGSPKKRSPSRK
jgi:hypothetical protein